MEYGISCQYPRRHEETGLFEELDPLCEEFPRMSTWNGSERPRDALCRLEGKAVHLIVAILKHIERWTKGDPPIDVPCIQNRSDGLQPTI